MSIKSYLVITTICLISIAIEEWEENRRNVGVVFFLNTIPTNIRDYSTSYKIYKYEDERLRHLYTACDIYIYIFIYTIPDWRQSLETLRVGKLLFLENFKKVSDEFRRARVSFNI